MIYISAAISTLFGLLWLVIGVYGRKTEKDKKEIGVAFAFSLLNLAAAALALMSEFVGG